MSNDLTNIRESLYELKREYGGPIDLYKLNTVTNNITTGIKSITKTKYHIRRAVIIPQSYIKHKVYSLSFIAANKNFTYGGLFNRNLKIFLIDKRDINVDIEQEDYILHKQKRYNVKDIDEIEGNNGYIIFGEAVDGLSPEAIYQINIFESIRFTQGVTSVLQ
jgi:hypothetical protein